MAFFQCTTPAFIANPTYMVLSKPSSTSATRSTSRRPLSSATKGATNKKVAQATAAAANAASASVDAAAAAATKQQRRKRGRASELTRKYRQVSDMDESILIGDDYPMPVSHQSLYSDVHSQRSTTTTKIPNSNKNRRPPSKRKTKKSILSDTKSNITLPSKNNNTSKLIQSSLSLNEDGKKLVLRSYSRFPSKWDDAVSQLCGSVAVALAHGFDRLKVDVKNMYYYIHQQQQQKQQDQYSMISSDETSMLAYAACSVLKHIIGENATSPCTKEIHNIQNTSSSSDCNSILQRVGENSNSMISMGVNIFKSLDNFTPRGALLLFNSRSDLQYCTSLLSEHLPQGVEVGVVGEVDPSKFVSNVVIVVSPCNQNNNPTHIEHVELVHYSNFNTRNWVIFLNPDLVGLSNYQSMTGEPRSPLFMADYLSTYYVEPVLFPGCVGGKGGVLRCFPRKWELYMSKAEDERIGRGLRLVSEQKVKPSREKIQCEFWWRIERELERNGGDDQQ